MVKKIMAVIGILALFLGVFPATGRAEGRSTAFDILPGLIHYPGLNAQAEMGYEFLEHGDFYKGFSTEIITIKNKVGVRYGFIQGVTMPWSAHEFGFSLPLSLIEETGIKFNLPPFLHAAGIHAAFGISQKNGVNVLTGQIGIVLFGGGI